MKKALFPILIFLLAVLLPAGSFAQNTHPYPIKVQTFIAPPYSLRLSDYVESGYDRISVTVSSRDETVLNYRISLKLVIESFDSRIRIETSPSYMSFPVFLTGTNPEMLSAYDVQDFFEISRLNFTGLSKNEYLRTGKLPEGYYRIFFVAIDYNHGMPGREVSDRKVDFAMAGLFLNDPPILNLPRKQEKVVLYEPRRILFEWTPRHKGSPNSAFDAEYVFRLYEVWDSWADANITASTRTPLFETVTSSPRYTYGIEAPELIPGKSYVWTVQAREEQNRDLFRNNGLSEAFIFQYGDECKIPLSLEGEPATGAGIELSWKGSAGHTGYLVRYRTKGTTDGWFEENSLISSARLSNLSYGITFEIQVMAECGSFSSGYCEPLMVAIPEEAPQNFVCGTTSNLPPITNKEPLEILLPGSTFTAGGFRCRVKEATGSNGEFSGTCLVVIPFYGYASVLHTFKNIKINTDYQMYAGKLVAVKDKEKQQEFARLLDDRPPVYTSGYNTDELAMILGAGNIISLDEPIKKIIAAPENGQYIVTYQDGSTDTIQVEEGTTVVVEDPKGNQYFIEDGKVKKINPEMAAAAVAASGGTAQTTSDPDSLREALPLVHFVPAENMTYGYDSLFYEALRSQYETKQVKGENYVVPFKAVATGQTDAIQASIPAGDYNGEAIRFKSGEVTVTSSPSGSGNNRKLSVTALSTGDIEPLEAIYTMQDTAGNIIEETLGLLNVVGYDAQTMKLVIVPVNNTDINDNTFSSIQTEINKIYSQAVVQWNVETHAPLFIDAAEINDANGKFDNTDRDERMDYTPAMKKVHKAFKKAFGTDKDVVYVFLIKGPCTDNTISGYMPFKGQYAFVFENQLGGESIRHTIAHEVAHGAFNLRHTFSNECPYYQAEKTSKNLMDYSGSSAITLNKYQWDLIHDPEIILFSWLQDEEEGEIIDLNPLVKVSKPVSSGSATFLTPSGLPIYFVDMSKMEEMYVTTKAFDETSVKIEDEVINYIVSDIGVLIAFKYNNTLFIPVIIKTPESDVDDIKRSDYQFMGYVDAEGNYYIESRSKTIKEFNVWWYNLGWSEKDYCFDISRYHNAQVLNAENYKGAGYYEVYMERRLNNSCTDFYTKLKPINPVEIYTGRVYAKYNPFGNDYGLYQKIEDSDGNIRYIYTNRNEYGEMVYFEYEDNDWVQKTFDKIPVSVLIDLDLLAKLAKDFGHSTLDIIGFIPVVGEAADALNGLWYLIEGEKLTATLCFASMIPLVGDLAFKSTKFTIKAIKGLKLTKSFEFTSEGLAGLAKISDLLKSGKTITCEECLNLIAKMLSENPENAICIEKLINSISKSGDFSTATRLLGNYDDLLKSDITDQFNQLRDATGKYRGAGTFWTRTSDNVVNHFSQNGKYMLKHDKTTHELLFVDIENGKVLGYYLDEIIDNGNVRRMIDNNYDEVILKLEKLHKGGIISTPSGYTIKSTPGKTTTILGSYNPDLQKVLEETGNMKNFNFKAKDGGFNMLNTPDNYFDKANPNKFWEDCNKPFLDEAISRGDNIVLASNPFELDRLFTDLDEIPSFDNVDKLAMYLKGYKNIDNLKGFGKELKYLFDNGYSYDAVKNVFLK